MSVLILLPPSEGKNSVEKGASINLSRLSFAKELTQSRKQTLNAIGSNLAKSACAEAINVYSGVLYQALDFDSLDKSSKKRAEKSILIFSALFGVLKIKDKIPSYKLDMAKSLPKIGSLNTFWKKIIPQTLEKIKTDLIIDCRSTTYQGVWTPSLDKTVAIRVFTIKNGKKSVVTHMSKKTRGEVSKILIQLAKPPRTPLELERIIKKHYRCQLIKYTKKTSWFLDVISS